MRIQAQPVQDEIAPLPLQIVSRQIHAGAAAGPITEEPEPSGPKILTVRLYGDIQNLDPAFQISENDTVVANAVMDGLVRYCPNSYDLCNELAEEIQESELRYLESYEKRPLRTQMRYFWKAVYNIIFRRARSA